MTFRNTYQQGTSLIELMVATALGLMIVAGATAIFVGNSRTQDGILKAHQLLENGRYAAALLSEDFRNAGYLAQFDPSKMATPVAPDPCATDLPSLRAGLAMPVQGVNNGTTVPSCIRDVRPGTDIVVMRRANACAVGDTGCEPMVENAVYLQASGCNSATQLGSGDPTTYVVLDRDPAAFDRTKVDCTAPAPLYRYQVNIYFIAQNYKSQDGIPTLKRAELGPSGFSIVPLVEGIENLQVEYGVDSVTAPSGIAAVFTSDPNSDEAWRRTVAARIHLLARSSAPSIGFVDTKTYSLGTHTVFKPTGVEATYKRHVFEAAVRVNNTAGRNLQ